LTETVLIVAGADTHADTIHVAAITLTGGAVGDREFPTTRTGYTAAIKFLTSLGQVARIGVEGTASYGAGFTRALTAVGIEVVEVTRAVKSTRRLKGKSDPLDAYSAARTALAGDGLATPKDEATAGLRALHIARRSAVKHRTAVINQIKAMLVSAPDAVREKYRGLTTLKLIEAIARCRPDTLADPWAQSVLTAVKMLAQRVQFLETQAEALEAQIDALVTEANPGLRAAYGVGPDTAAQLLITAGANPHRLHSEAAFAALSGTAPVPASSGKTNRHRLSRGGDRAANNALHRIALIRMSSHQPTKNYVQRQVAKGHNKMEILRKLKRAIAREVFKLLTRQIAVPDYADLRPARQAKNITVTAAANHFGIWPTVEQ
jgi:transposase